MGDERERIRRRRKSKKKKKEDEEKEDMFENRSDYYVSVAVLHLFIVRFSPLHRLFGVCNDVGPEGRGG